MSKYVIIGSGISGCTAAEELARQGNSVELIESSNTIGGSILGYTCKATDECSRCGVCVAHTQLNTSLKHDRITTSVGASIQSVSNNSKNIDTVITRKNPSISYHECIFCDKCVYACPEQCISKIQRGEFVQYVIDYDRCLIHKGKQCAVCSDACPPDAIFSQTETTEITISSDAALVATGHEPYDASKKMRLGYGRVENVITGVEAEEILSRQTYLGDPTDNIAFIQCVGSRDPQIGRNYCSSVCCAYALRLAHIMKYRHAATPVTIYYIDIQNFDKTFTLFRKSVEDSGVRFVRGVPFLIERSSTGRLKLHIENMDGEESIVEHDMVVLSVGMGPTTDSEKIASLFGLKKDEFGFFSSSLANVFVSGTCKEPLSITDSMASARAVALEMLHSANKEQSFNRTINSIQKAVNTVSELPPFETKKVPLQQSVLVVGGGIAGVSAAQGIHRFGYSTTIVEQTKKVGGQIFPDLFPRSEKKSDPFAGKLSRPVLSATEREAEGVEILTGSSLIELTGNIGDFSARLETPKGEKTIQCGAVVVASGSRVPAEVSKSSLIVSMLDIDLAIADLAKRRGLRSMGLILDRDIDEGKASTEMALTLAKSIQGMNRYQAHLFCRDIRVAARELELLYDEAREAGVNIVKYDGKLSFSETDTGVLVTYTDAILCQEMTIYCDRIAISPFGLSISADTDLVEITGLSTDAYGQIQDNNIHLFPEQTNRPGIFTVGSCRGQHYVPQIIAEAKATALEVHTLLSQKSLEIELSNAVVDPDKCILCLTCVRSCPYKAMQVNREKGSAESIPEVCQKCGICAGECPAKAIELPVYSDKVILSYVNA